MADSTQDCRDGKPVEGCRQLRCDHRVHVLTAMYVGAAMKTKYVR